MKFGYKIERGESRQKRSCHFCEWVKHEYQGLHRWVHHWADVHCLCCLFYAVIVVLFVLLLYVYCFQWWIVVSMYGICWFVLSARRRSSGGICKFRHQDSRRHRLSLRAWRLGDNDLVYMIGVIHIYTYIYTHIYVYTHVTVYSVSNIWMTLPNLDLCLWRSVSASEHDGDGAAAGLGAKDCTPEIDTSESIVDFRCRFPMDFQWHVPTEFHSSVVFSKGLSFSSGFPLELFNGFLAAFSNGVSRLWFLVCNTLPWEPLHMASYLTYDIYYITYKVWHTVICMYIRIHIYIYICTHVCIYTYRERYTHISAIVLYCII